MADPNVPMGNHSGRAVLGFGGPASADVVNETPLGGDKVERDIVFDAGQPTEWRSSVVGPADPGVK